ncbi:hypothetical protein RQN30_02300 [Arcanobacterium hippocoleae]
MSTWATSGGIGGAGATIEIDDIQATLKALNDFGVAAKDLRAGFRPASQLLARKIRATVPVRDKYLRKSIRARARIDRADVTIGGRSAYYAPVIHFGWHAHNIQPNQFMFRALDQSQNEIVKTLQESLMQIAHANGLETV